MDDAGVAVAAFGGAQNDIEFLFLDRRGQQFCRRQRVGTGHRVVENMHRRRHAHRQRVADADGYIAGAHGHQYDLAAMFLDQTQPFFHRARRHRIELVGHALAHHAFVVGVELDDDRARGNDFTADDDVQCFALPWKNSPVTNTTKAPLGQGASGRETDLLRLNFADQPLRRATA